VVIGSGLHPAATAFFYQIIYCALLSAENETITQMFWWYLVFLVRKTFEEFFL